MRNLKFAARLGIGFSLVLGGLLLFGVFVIARQTEVNGLLETITGNRYPKVVHAYEATRQVEIATQALRDVVAAGSSQEARQAAEALIAARRNLAEHMDRLGQSIHSPQGLELVQAMREVQSQLARAQDSIIELAGTGHADRALGEIHRWVAPLQTRLEQTLDALIARQTESMATAERSAAKSLAGSRLTFVALASGLVALTAGLALWLFGAVAQRLDAATDLARQLANGNLAVAIPRSAGDEAGALLASMDNMAAELSQIISSLVTTADAIGLVAHRVSLAAQNLSNTASAQVTAGQAAKADFESIKAALHRNAGNAWLTDNVAAKSSAEIDAAAQALDEGIAIMKTLGVRIGLIHQIARQAHLLALSASVEAGRAGSEGKGFAVVAEEIKRLADQAQATVTDLAPLPDACLRITDQGSSLLADAAILNGRTSRLLQGIATESREHSIGIGRISQAMERLHQDSLRTEVAARDLAAIARELDTQARKLGQMTTFFRLARPPLAVAERLAADPAPARSPSGL